MNNHYLASISLNQLSCLSFMAFGIFQNEVRIMLNVGESSLSLFRAVLRYINPGTEAVSGHITIYPSQGNTGR